MIFAEQSKTLKRGTTRIVGERSSALDLARGRLVLLGAIFALAYILISARAIDLTLVQPSLVKSESAQTLGMAAGPAVKPARADITDRNGVILATTLKAASLYADPRLISDIPAASRGLARIFPDLNEADILQKLESSRKRFVWLRKNLTPQDQRAVLMLGEPGLGFTFEDRRIYPQGRLTSHLVGFTDRDNTGLAGLEREFNTPLSQGRPLGLTLDVRLQHILHREVAKAIADFNAKAGVGLIMDVRTGDVLAGVSMPDFDPHGMNTIDKNAQFNRMTLGTYELGSVIKIFSTAEFLETHRVPLSTTFDASMPLREGRFVISDYHAQKRALTIPEIFMYSSNIGTAMMGQAVGTARLKSFYDKVGLTTPLDIDFPEIARPQVPNPWRDINTLTASYGHGMAVTPMQFLAAASSVVNDGLLVKPRLVEANGDPAVQTRILSENTSAVMREMLRLVVLKGTGSKADVDGYNIGGKTGTAEKPGLHGYDSNKLISSFVGFFPIEKPQYAVFVLIDEPKGNKQSYGYATAGWVSAPAVGRVISSMGSVLGLAPQKNIASAAMDNSLTQYVSLQTHE